MFSLFFSNGVAQEELFRDERSAKKAGRAGEGKDWGWDSEGSVHSGATH